MSEKKLRPSHDKPHDSGDEVQFSPADSGEYHKELIEFSADAIISIDELGVIELFNGAASRLFGYSPAEALGQNIKIMMPAPYHGNHDGYLATYMRTGEAKILGSWREVEGLRKDGTKVPIEIGIRLFRIRDRQIFTAIVRDLTELKRIQKEVELKALDIAELSTPVLSVWKDVLVLPLIGTLDSRRMQDCMERALTRLSDSGAQVLILDVTGVPFIDTMVANHLMGLASSIHLMGGHSIITGISPSTAMTIVSLGLDLKVLNTRGTLNEGLKLAMTLTKQNPWGQS